MMRSIILSALAAAAYASTAQDMTEQADTIAALYPECAVSFPSRSPSLRLGRADGLTTAQQHDHTETTMNADLCSRQNRWDA